MITRPVLLRRRSVNRRARLEYCTNLIREFVLLGMADDLHAEDEGGIFHGERGHAFQRRLAFLVSGGTLVTLGVRNRLTPVGGIVLAAMGGLLLRAGVGWLKSRLDNGSERDSDIVHESSDEYFPASDPPSWVYGKQ